MKLKEDTRIRCVIGSIELKSGVLKLAVRTESLIDNNVSKVWVF